MHISRIIWPSLLAVYACIIIFQWKSGKLKGWKFAGYLIALACFIFALIAIVKGW
jgi:hypothetical protein